MNYSRILLLAGLVGLASCQPKTDSSLSTPADNSVAVATVNGTNISQNFFEQYIKAITGKASSELTAEQRTQALDNLIRAQVVGQQAAKDGIDKVPPQRAPAIGQHSEAVLREAGYGADDIARLRSLGVLA